VGWVTHTTTKSVLVRHFRRIIRAMLMSDELINNKTTTPPRISEQILELCRKLDPSQEPVYVPVRPWQGGRVDSCFYNIEDKIKVDGGGVQYGWTIWEKPEILIEAEFHAVWVSPENELIDITEKADAEPQILFLPDSNRVWEGEMIDNVRAPLVDNAYTRHLIRYAEAMFKLRKKYWRNGVSMLPYEELQRHEWQYGMHTIKVGRNEPCYCGSGKKYKKCHGT